MRDGVPIPPKIQTAPTLGLGLQLYWNAFLELHSCRSGGWGSGPIPWTAMRDYASAYELDDEQTEDLMQVVRAMDNAYLEFEAKRQKSTEAKRPIGHGHAQGPKSVKREKIKRPR